MGWLRDCGFLAGLVLIGVGCWMIHPALMCVVVGGNLVGLSVWGTLRDPK